MRPPWWCCWGMFAIARKDDARNTVMVGPGAPRSAVARWKTTKSKRGADETAPIAVKRWAPAGWALLARFGQ